MTFCPWPMYRKKGFYFQKEDFDKNTFDLKDVFHPVMLPELNNKSLYQIKTSQSLFYGKCFTIKYKVIQILKFFLVQSFNTTEFL